MPHVVSQPTLLLADGARLDVDAHVLLELTKRCNYACAHCFTDASPTARSQEPAPDEVLELARSAACAGFSAITLSGGEPMLYRDIGAVVERWPAAADLWLFTSGIRLTAERLRQWASTVTGYAVSLDGGAARHNTLRKSPRAFSDVTGFLRRLVEVDARVQIQSMVQRGRLDHIGPIVELAETLGVERVLFSHVSPVGRGVSMADAAMSWRELDALESEVAARRASTPVALRTNLVPKEAALAGPLSAVLHVLPTGAVLPWLGVSPRFAVAQLSAHGWDLETALAGEVAPAAVGGVFARARRAIEVYPGSAVPVDDIIAVEFGRAAA